MTIQSLDALADAIAAIIEQDNALIATVSGLAAAYRGCAPMPARPGRLSALLNCETNGAHILLENFAHAAKAIPRGAIPHESLDAFLVSCGDLVEALIQVLADDPNSLATLHEVGMAESRFTNFLKGVSGADKRLSARKCALRIDLFIRDLKRIFIQLGRALVYFEYHLTRPRPEECRQLDTTSQTIISTLGGKIDSTRKTILEVIKTGHQTKDPRPVEQRHVIDLVVLAYTKKAKIDHKQVRLATLVSHTWDSCIHSGKNMPFQDKVQFENAVRYDLRRFYDEATLLMRAQREFP